MEAQTISDLYNEIEDLQSQYESITEKYFGCSNLQMRQDLERAFETTLTKLYNLAQYENTKLRRNNRKR